MPYLAVFLAGLTISAALFVVVLRHSQNDDLQQMYQEEAVPLTVVLGRSIENTLNSIASIGRLFAASNEVERDEFRAYVELNLARDGEIQAIEWIPRVSAGDRVAYETAARRDGFTDFRITERNSSGEMVPAAVRNEYFPVYFVEPLDANEVALGFDMASDPLLLEALNRARDTGRIAASQKIRMVHGTGEQYGFVAFAPVYSTGSVPETVAVRREKLTGFALGVFRIEDILQTAIARTQSLSKLDLYVLDATAPSDAMLLYFRGAPGQDHLSLSAEELLLDGYKNTVLSVGDRNWLLVFVPPEGSILPTNAAPWVVGLFGLLLTVGFILFLRTTQIRTRVIGQTVFGRTAELAAANRALEEERAERTYAEQMLWERNDALHLMHRLTVAGDKAVTVDDAIQICLEEVCSFTDWPVGHAFRPNEDNPDEFVSTGVWHLATPERGLEDFIRASEAAKFLPGEGTIGEVLASGKPRWISDVNQDNDYVRAGSNGMLPFKGAFFIPLLAGQTVVAVLEFYALEAIEPDEKILAVVAQIGSQLGGAVERVQAAKKLRDSEEFVRLIADSLPVVIAYFDKDKIIRFINQLAVEWHQRSREEIIGNPLAQNITAVAAQNHELRMQKVLGGEAQTFDRSLTYPDGKFRHVTISYVPHFDRAGDVVGFFGIVQDISERLEIERQLNQAQKMDAIGQLTGGIAHDFNNILMVTDGYTRRALRDIDDPDAVTTALEEVLAGTDRAAQLTKQLLAFSRRQIIEKRVFRVEEAISDIEELLQKSTGERYQLHIESHTEGACVETDASEFSQALVNLVINARDAMPRGGCIKITSRVVELDEEFAAMHQKLSAGRFVEVAVKDNGIGIDEDTLKHIFEPFFTTKDQGKGTGLGLAMVYGFAQNSQGSVEVESTLEVGTTIKMLLPAVDRNPQAVIAEVEQENLGRGETILLVEDDAPLLELAREMLASLGYNVLTASDGFEAMEVEAAHGSEIDLVLSDVVMPSIGGFEMATIMREARPGMKFVFMSGYPNRADISSENVPDNCQFLQKPVKPSHLAQALRNELDRAGTQFPGCSP
ncbi:MAG: CHASE domain-containing protein [Alphaproteobacteria bacterium]|nr:CHASE domain-containing protein [Alphaproteobacteria bacterium]